MKITLEKQFETRDELDTYVRTTFGEDAEKNKDIVLETDAATLQKLALDEKSVVHGVKVRTTKEVK